MWINQFCNLHYYFQPGLCISNAAKISGRHILGFSIKWVAVTTASSFYGCSLAVVKSSNSTWTWILYCASRCKTLQWPSYRIIKSNTKACKRSFPSKNIECSIKISHFSLTDLLVLSKYFCFLNMEHLSLLRQVFGCFTGVNRVNKHG